MVEPQTLQIPFEEVRGVKRSWLDLFYEKVADDEEEGLVTDTPCAGRKSMHEMGECYEAPLEEFFKNTMEPPE